MAIPKKEIIPKTVHKPRRIKWRVQVRTDEGKRINKRFDTKREATQFLAALELEQQQIKGRHEAQGLSFGDAIKRYRKEGLAGLKDAKWTRNTCDRLMTYDIAKVPVLKLNDRHAYKHIMFREGQGVGASSIIREFTVMKRTLRLCEKWYGLEYPWDRLVLPKAGEARSRLITDAEEAQMAAAVGLDIDTVMTIETANERAVAGFLFSCDTAMRLGEVAGLTFGMIDFKDHVMNLPSTLCKGKKGTNSAREAIIPENAQKILSKLAYRSGDPADLVFGLDADTMATLFRRVKRSVFGPQTPEGFTFHDSRHLAITRLARTGIPVVALAKTVGHKDLNQLQTYYEESGANIAKQVREHQRINAMLKDKGVTREQAIAAHLAAKA